MPGPQHADPAGSMEILQFAWLVETPPQWVASVSESGAPHESFDEAAEMRKYA